MTGDKGENDVEKTTDQWRPRPGEQVFIEGRGRRSDFMSVQTTLEATDDEVLLTGGWRFGLFEGEWRWMTKGADVVVVKAAPHLNQHRKDAA